MDNIRDLYKAKIFLEFVRDCLSKSKFECFVKTAGSCSQDSPDSDEMRKKFFKCLLVLSTSKMRMELLKEFICFMPSKNQLDIDFLNREFQNLTDRENEAALALCMLSDTKFCLTL